MTTPSSSFTIENVIFMVDTEPYCLWSTSSNQARTLDYLARVDPGFFAYQGDVHRSRLRAEEKERSALALRLAYAHGLETVMSFLCAALQAPYCVPGWLLRCSNKQLYKIVNKLNHQEYVPSWLQLGPLDWQKVASEILKFLNLEDKAYQSFVVSQFGETWKAWAQDFSREMMQREYNSIKHGFRTTFGGFKMELERASGSEQTHSLQEDQDRIIGGEYGTAFYDYVMVGDGKRHMQLQSKSSNWDPIQLWRKLHLISYSMFNIVSYLKLMNGASIDSLAVYLPKDKETFQNPDEGISGPSLSIWLPIPPEYITNFSKSELEAFYNKGAVVNQKTINY